MKNLIKVILPAVLMLSASSLWATSQILTFAAFGSTNFDATTNSFHASSGGRLGVSGNPSAQNIQGQTAANSTPKRVVVESISRRVVHHQQQQ